VKKLQSLVLVDEAGNAYETSLVEGAALPTGWKIGTEADLKKHLEKEKAADEAFAKRVAERKAQKVATVVKAFEAGDFETAVQLLLGLTKKP
jgi:hypothetical protein